MNKYFKGWRLLVVIVPLYFLLNYIIQKTVFENDSYQVDDEINFNHIEKEKGIIVDSLITDYFIDMNWRFDSIRVTVYRQEPEQEGYHINCLIWGQVKRMDGPKLKEDVKSILDQYFKPNHYNMVLKTYSGRLLSSSVSVYFIGG